MERNGRAVNELVERSRAQRQDLKDGVELMKIRLDAAADIAESIVSTVSRRAIIYRQFAADSPSPKRAERYIEHAVRFEDFAKREQEAVQRLREKARRPAGTTI